MNRIAIILLALILGILFAFLFYFFSNIELGKSKASSDNYAASQDKDTHTLIEEDISNSEENNLEDLEVKYRLYLVLDDAGAKLEEVSRFTSFSGSFTVAILPDLKDSKKIAQYLYKMNIPYIIHLPMEPIGDENPGSRALITDMSDKELHEMISYNLNYFKHYIGLNNHMGSKATTDSRIVNALLKQLSTNKIILDSRTTKNTILEREALNQNFIALHRDVFIDNFDDSLYIMEQIRKAIKIAQKDGYAILIGHVMRSQILDALESIYNEVIESGGQFSSLDDFIP